MSAYEPVFIAEYTEWLRRKISGMIHEMEKVSPSEFAERTRYLPASVTNFPGYFDYSVNPFMREIVDCFDIRSSVREVSLMKGVQVTYTTTLENVLLYFMAQVKTAPVMFMTADAELAQARVENSILPMINLSGLGHIIQSSDPNNRRKTGQTRDHIQWAGGGYMVPFGANNAAKMRMFSIMVMLKDELDGWPDTVGKDGEPDRVSDDRCSAYWERRKIFRGSTPLIKHTSKILKAYNRGDQRQYNVRCRSCAFPQALRWSGTNKETGLVYGFDWELQDGSVVLESVGYLCKNCGHKHYEHDKTKLFSEKEGAVWVPTAKAAEVGIRSYQLPAWYSPVGMQPWYKNVLSWVDAWDVERKAPKDNALLQVFYNNVMAEPYEINGDKLTFSTVSSLRRTDYRLGEVPNDHALAFCGGEIQLLTCAVDVHDKYLFVAVFGWAKGRRAYLIDYWRFEGDGKDLQDPGTWGKLHTLITTKEYTATDGKKYTFGLTLIDAGHMYETVVSFAAQFPRVVYATVGRQTPPKTATIKEFWPFTGPTGTTVYGLSVDLYKDRWSVALRRYWDNTSEQPEGHFNAPVDTTDKQIRELTAETRREKKDKLTNKVVGAEWYRPSGAANELWDLTVYNSAALDMIAYDVCVNQFELDHIEWPQFWQYCAENAVYFTNL